MTQHPDLLVEQKRAALYVTLNNPAKRNAQTPTLWAALTEIARTLDPSVRVVVLQAAGDDFSAGLDLHLMSPEGIKGEPKIPAIARARGEQETANLIATFQEAFTAWREVDAIVVAAVQGHAIGAGFQLALAADLRIVTEDCKLALKETSLGLVPDLGGIQPLVQAVGYSRALEIALMGRWVTAQEAVNSGIACLGVPRSELKLATGQVVDAICENSDLAVRELKKLMVGATERTQAEQLQAEREAQARLLVDMVTPEGFDRGQPHSHDHTGHDHTGHDHSGHDHAH